MYIRKNQKRLNSAMNRKSFSKWVSCWGNATSITDRQEAVYAKDITLRYPMRIVFNGDKLRFRFSNLTGTEPVRVSGACIDCKKEITFEGESSVEIAPGTEITSDEIIYDVTAGDTIEISMYFEDFTQMNAGTLITGPLSKGRYSYGNFLWETELPADLTRNTNWFYFLNTIDIFTEEKNHALICYGDSITSQDWPDYLQKLMWENNKKVSVVRKAVSGTRILRQYSCVQYEAYGLKGDYRFGHEMHVAGSDTLIILQGINDIIHPVGVEKNEFRPWQDLPSSQELIEGLRKYVKHAKSLGMKVYIGTLIPIEGWRTYAYFRENLRNEVNEWIRTTDEIDGVIDFDKDICDGHKMQDAFDSGDHLHPSDEGYAQMAKTAYNKMSME